MFVFRSLALGLLGACFWLLATRPVAIVVRDQPRDAALHDIRRLSGIGLAAPVEAPTIIDVAPGVTAAQLPSLVQLHGGEHVMTVDDTPVAGDLDAGRVLAQLDLRARSFIDLGVAGPHGERRVLVLLH
jgi:hypothetical protein